MKKSHLKILSGFFVEKTFFAIYNNNKKMGTYRNVWATQIPGSGQALASPGSQYITIDGDLINWPTLASKTGTTASSMCVYGPPPGSNQPNLKMKLSVASVRNAFGVINT